MTSAGDVLKLVVVLGAAALVAITAAVFSARLWWAFDLFTHFRLQYVVAAVAFGVAAVALGAYRSAALLAIVALVHGWAIKDLWIGGPEETVVAGEPLRIISANVLGSNPTPDQVLAFVRGADADVVVLVEVGSERWDGVLADLAVLYPYGAPGQGRERDPVRMFSRYPVTNHRLVKPEGGRRPYLEAEIDVGSTPVVVSGVHPPSPSPTADAATASLITLLTSSKTAIDR